MTYDNPKFLTFVFIKIETAFSKKGKLRENIYPKVIKGICFLRVLFGRVKLIEMLLFAWG